MVGKVIHYNDATLDAPDFLATFDALKSLQGLGDKIWCYPNIISHSNDRQYIQEIMATHKWHLKSAERLSTSSDSKMCPGWINAHIFKPPGQLFPKTVQCGPATGLAYEISYNRIATVADQ